MHECKFTVVQYSTDCIYICLLGLAAWACTLPPRSPATNWPDSSAKSRSYSEPVAGASSVRLAPQRMATTNMILNIAACTLNRNGSSVRTAARLHCVQQHHYMRWSKTRAGLLWYIYVYTYTRPAHASLLSDRPYTQWLELTFLRKWKWTDL